MALKPAVARLGVLAEALVVVSPSAAQAAPTRHEAENPPTVCSGTIDANRPGYSGSGFRNGANSTSGHLQFTASAATAGNATPSVRFANGSTARTADLVVNRADVGPGSRRTPVTAHRVPGA